MVGDVVGHGLEASAAMGRLSTAAVVLARMCEGPGAMLSNLNRYVSEVGPVDFATAVYAVLDAGTGAIRYASAGHPPMLMVEASGWRDGSTTDCLRLCTDLVSPSAWKHP
jgi:serine phosphatase RsbU (regulator of sigma subunit)